jgi:hypoxanthine phosphoribosyltransferase
MDSHPELHSLLPRAEIAETVSRLASEITRDYRDKTPLLLGILKGSFMEVEFIQLSSYGSGQQTSGRVEVIQGLRTPVGGRHVLVVEDIVDTGITIAFLLNYLEGQKPASVRLCALADKPSRRQVPVNIDYRGFTVPDRFLVGYGLDCDEKYRNLPDICFLEA